MLKAAFNALSKLHSRAATIKRPGTPDIYTPARLSPSNYFRFLRGPEYTTVKGVEFVIPVDTMTGEFSQSFVFNNVPDDGDFKLKFGTLETGVLNFDASAAQIQTALRLLSGFGSVTVTAITSGFKIIFSGVSISPDLGQLEDSTLVFGVDPVTATFTKANIPWTKPLKKGDIIIDGSNRWTADEVIEMHDIGASIIGYRVRAD